MPPARRRYHHGDLRRSLVQAATRLLDRRGPTGVTLRGAARQAGVSQAAPYRHFPSKDALLAAVAAESFHALRRACETAAAVAREADPARRLEGVAVAYVRFAVEHPARYRLMWAPAPRGRDHPGLREAARSSSAPLVALLAAAGADGAATAPPVERLFVFWALLHGLAGLVLDEQLPHEVLDSVPVDELVRAAMRVVGKGLLGEHAGGGAVARGAP